MVCLIQLSSFEYTVVIDALQLRHVLGNYLKGFFENEKILKVLHGCYMDLKCLLSNFGCRIFPLFDTAQAFGRLEDSIFFKTKNEAEKSLKFLCKYFLQFDADKSYQRANYALRPMTKKMYQYALNDAKMCTYLFSLLMGFVVFLKEQTGEYYAEKYVAFFENREGAPVTTEGKLKFKDFKAYKGIPHKIFDASEEIMLKNEEKEFDSLIVNILD